MPLALDLDRFVEYSLKSDLEKSAESRPLFKFRYFSDRAWKEFVSLREKARGSEDGPADLDAVLATVKKFVKGWENLTTTDPDIAKSFGVELVDGVAKLPFNHELIDLVLGVGEEIEILERVPTVIFQSEADVKAAVRAEKKLPTPAAETPAEEPHGQPKGDSD